MKINKFVVMAAIAIMAVGAMGFINIRSHGQNGTAPAPQVQVTEASDGEMAATVDTDNIEEQVGDQVGDQNSLDTSIESANEAPETNAGSAADVAPAGTVAITSKASTQAVKVNLNTAASGTAPAPKIQVAEVSDGEKTSVVDTDNVEEQVGDQVDTGQIEGAN